MTIAASAASPKPMDRFERFMLRPLKFLRVCDREAVALTSFTREQMQEFHPAFPAASAKILDLAGSLAKRDLVGGTSHKRVSEALDTATRELEEQARVLEDAGQHIEGSK